MTSRGWSVSSAAQSRNDERKPCGTASIRRSLSILSSVDAEIRRFRELGVSKTAIAKLTGVSRTALYSFMNTRELRPSR